jgi:hypothetical protein
VFWRLRRSSIIISAELHEKLARTSPRIEEVASEVVGVRTLSDQAEYDPEHEPLCPSEHDDSAQDPHTDSEAMEPDGSRSYWLYP